MDGACRPACHEALFLEVADEELDVVVSEYAADVFRIDYRAGINSLDFVVHDVSFLVMLQRYANYFDFLSTFNITIANNITKAAIHCTGEYFVPLTK